MTRTTGNATGITLLALLATSAHGFEPGQHVEASPLMMESSWEPCEIVSQLPGGDWAITCGARRTEYVVPERWLRAAEPSSAASAATASSGTPAAPAASASPAAAATAAVAAQVGGTSALETGDYDCAAGPAGTLKLAIRSASEYADRNGAVGRYRYDAGSAKIVFESGPWAGNYGARLGPGKIGVSSRPDGFYYATCDRR